MRKLLLCLALSAPIAAHANDTCDFVHTIATVTMEARQAGISAKEVVDRASKIDVNASTRALIEATIIDAYKRPRYTSNERKERAVTDFADDAYLVCLRVSKGL